MNTRPLAQPARPCSTIRNSPDGNAAVRLPAVAADAAEDALFGASSRGDELPGQLARRAERLERLRAAKAQVDQQAAARAARAAKADAYERAVAEQGRRPPGRPPKPPGPADKPPRASATDPDSRVMRSKDGYLQGYNAQVLAGGDQLVLAAGAFSDQGDVRLLHPMLARGQANLAAAGITSPVRAALADAGYAPAANFTAARTPILLVAVAKEARQAGRAPGPARISKAHQPMAARLATPAGRRLYQRRSPMVEPVFAQMLQRGGRRIRYRGLQAADAEICLWATTHNLLKYHTRITRPPQPG